MISRTKIEIPHVNPNPWICTGTLLLRARPACSENDVADVRISPVPVTMHFPIIFLEKVMHSTIRDYHYPSGK